MDKNTLYRIFVVLILFSITISPILVLNANGQWYTRWAEVKVIGDVPPRETTKPPTISIQNPQNNSLNSGTANISIYTSITPSGDGLDLYLQKIYYETDWQTYTTTVFDSATNRTTILELNETITIGDIPEGNHTITIFTLERGQYEEPQPYALFHGFLYYFSINNSAMLTFTTDKTIPITSFSLPEDNKYYSSTINLNYTISEKVSQLKYSLDGQDQISNLFSKNFDDDNNTAGFGVIGTLILSNLTDGEHNVTMYATDLAGNIGVSETIYFTINSFPTTLVLTSVVIIAVVGIGIILYFKKWKS